MRGVGVVPGPCEAGEYIHSVALGTTVLYFKTFEGGPERDWVVFVHGAGGSSRIWYKQVLDFSRQFNVLLLDLRGHGQSQQEDTASSPNAFTIEGLSRDILDVLDHLEIRQAHFVGISMGCVLIRALAEVEPERVRTMTLAGAITHLDWTVWFWVALGNTFKYLMPYLWIYRFFTWIVMPGRRHRAARRLFVGEARQGSQREFKRWFALTWQARTLLQQYAAHELAIPTLYLMGQRDYLFLPSARALVKKHSASVLEVVEGAGHVCNVEQEERFNAQAIAFIKGHPVAPLGGASSRHPASEGQHRI